MLTLIQNFIWGVAMAFGELLPGVGMQTVAIIAGIYDDMITFLYEGTEFLKTVGLVIIGKAKKQEVLPAFKAINWKFGIPLGIGVVITIVILAHAVSALFDSYPTQVAAISFGIVLASVVIPYKEMGNKTWKEALLFLISFITFYGLFTLQTTETTTEPSIFLFLGGGLLASVAAFFPGISISFALLIMGLYKPLLNSIETLTSGSANTYALLVLFLFLAGLGIGLLVCVRLLAFFMNKHKSMFLAFIVGLILASLRAIWPFAENSTVVLPWQLSLPQLTQQLIFITIAFVSVSMIRKLAENKGTLASSFGPKEKVGA